MIYHSERLANVHPSLVLLVEDVSDREDVDVITGARSIDDERRDIASGRSHLLDPLNSKHVIAEGRPTAEAVDLTRHPVKWMDIAGFKSLALVVKARAAELGIAIEWGGDWGWDLDHFQLAKGAA